MGPNDPGGTSGAHMEHFTLSAVEAVLAAFKQAHDDVLTAPFITTPPLREVGAMSVFTTPITVPDDLPALLALHFGEPPQ